MLENQHNNVTSKKQSTQRKIQHQKFSQNTIQNTERNVRETSFKTKL